MITESEIQQLEKQLIKDDVNYVPEIAKKLNMSRTTIYKFFECEPLSKGSAVRIYDAALDVLQEARNKAEDRRRKVKKLIHGGSQQTSLNV